MRPFIPPLLCLAAACTHHRHIASPQALHGETVEVATPAGVVTAEAVETPQGVVVFRDSETGRVMAPSEVAKFEVKDHGTGAIEGLAWGGLGGAALGAVIGYAGGDDSCKDDLCISFSAEEKAVFGALGGGLIGGLCGLLVGAIAGSRDVYENPTWIARPHGPRGSAAGLTLTF